jgi:parallel beta-helix repeat protein
MKNSWLKKGLVIGIIGLFIGTGVSSAITEPTSTSPQPLDRGNWLYVGGSGPGNYTRIQYAIDNASDGDTVFVYNGTYFESRIFINESINLLGENNTNTIIYGQYWFDPLIRINSDNVTVENFKILNSSVAISLNSSCNSTIQNNILNPLHNDSQYSPFVIAVYKSNYSVVANNTIYGQRTGGSGVYVYFSYHNLISNNTLFSCGIYIEGSHNTVTNNYISQSWDGIAILGIWEQEWAHNNTVMMNTIIFEGFSFGHTGVNMKGARFNNISYNTIIGGSIFAYSVGIVGQNTPNNIFYQNEIIGVMYGTEFVYDNWGSFPDDNFAGREDKKNIIFRNNFKRVLFPARDLFRNFSNFYNNLWAENYWNIPRIFPKIILCMETTKYSNWGIPKMFEFDWHPAKQPHDIPRIAI